MHAYSVPFNFNNVLDSSSNQEATDDEASQLRQILLEQASDLNI